MMDIVIKLKMEMKIGIVMKMENVSNRDKNENRKMLVRGIVMKMGKC